MNSLFEKFRKRVVIRELVSVSVWISFAQIISFLTLPIFTRIYTPDDIGTLGLFTAVVSIFAVLAPFQLDQAILTATNEKQTEKTISTMLSLSVGFTFLLWLIILFARQAGISSLLKIPEIAMFLIPAFVIPAVLFRTIGTVSLRAKIVVVASIAASTSQVLATVAKIALGYRSPTLESLLIGELIYFWFCFGLSSAIFVFWYKKPMPKLLFGWDRKILSDNKSLLKSGQTAVAFNAINTYLPIHYVAFLFSPVDTGLFALSFGLIAAVSRNLSQSITQVFMNRFSNYHRSENYQMAHDFIHKAIIYGGAIALSAGTILATAAHPLLPLLLGPKWIEAANIFAPLSFWLVTTLLYSPSAAALKILKKTKMLLIYEVLVSIIYFLMVLGAHQAGWSIEKYLWLVILTQGFVTAIFSLLVLRFHKNAYK